MPAERVFEYTDSHLRERFRPDGELDFDALMSLPTLFLQESFGSDEQIAKVGTINRIRDAGRDLLLRYTYDTSIPPLNNKMITRFAHDLDIFDDFEFHRTHWAVKDVDLFQTLLRNLQPRRQRPRVFHISDIEAIEPSLVSVMMPFSSDFDAVYDTIKNAVQSCELKCRRADDIWENPAVIQDVVSLIDHSTIVICDCTNRNPNVFYEIGIAHTLGREVMLITQLEDDIPFDLRHLRFAKYLNNGEGRSALAETLKKRLKDVASWP